MMYKKEIIIAVIAAVISAILSLSVLSYERHGLSYERLLEARFVRLVATLKDGNTDNLKDMFIEIGRRQVELESIIQSSKKDAKFIGIKKKEAEVIVSEIKSKTSLSDVEIRKLFTPFIQSEIETNIKSLASTFISGPFKFVTVKIDGKARGTNKIEVKLSSELPEKDSIELTEKNSICFLSEVSGQFDALVERVTIYLHTGTWVYDVTSGAAPIHAIATCAVYSTINDENNTINDENNNK